MMSYERLAEVYIDYLIVANGQVIAILSAISDSRINYDRFTRMPSSGKFSMFFGNWE